MLGTLSLMACTLMLAAVPSLSSSMQPREEVDLPAIGYVMYDDNYIGIQPLALGTTLNPSLEPLADSVTYHLGGHEVTIAPLSHGALTLFYNPSSDGELDMEESFPNLAGASYPACVFVSGAALHATDVDVYLPDLSYWYLDGSSYYITIAYDAENGSPVFARYGNQISEDGVMFYTLAELGADVNPIGAIGDGLGIVGALGGALSDGFDGVFLSNGALTAVGTFSFVLLGLGISVGIVKKCFNWVTGRHGM